MNSELSKLAPHLTKLFWSNCGLDDFWPMLYWYRIQTQHFSGCTKKKNPQQKLKSSQEPKPRRAKNKFFLPRSSGVSHLFLINKTKSLTISYSTDGLLHAIEWKEQVLNITEPHSATSSWDLYKSPLHAEWKVLFKSVFSGQEMLLLGQAWAQPSEEKLWTSVNSCYWLWKGYSLWTSFHWVGSTPEF